MAAAPSKSQRKDAKCHVGIVDDEPGIRFLLTRLFESAGIPCRSFANAESLLDEVEEVCFGCLVVDIVLSGISGLELQAELHRRGFKVAVIVISGRATVPDVIQAFSYRASAFFEKPLPNQELLATVRTEIQAWSEREKKRRALELLLKPLSPREVEVMRALMAGRKTIQIAHDLEISPSTVEKHRLKVFAKTGADSVIELIHRVAAYETTDLSSWIPSSVA